ncbi:MAG: hypothetical protein NTV03_03800, partial [Candidatus Nomurabacteria bacterium]|nr:hypothetical protein [Candidatus Nomurabacteria bacterium]
TKTPGEIIDSNCPSGNVGCIMKTSISLTLKEVSVSVNNKIVASLNSLSNTSDNLASGWSTFTNLLLDNSENGIHNDKELIITLGNVSLSTSSALASGWSTFTNQLIDNGINTLTAHKQFADNLNNNLTKGTLAYTNGILNIPEETTRAFSGTKDLGLATTASVGDSLLGASNGISDGWVSFTNTIINNTKQSLTDTKDLAVSIWNNITSIPETIRNGAETFIATLKGPAPITQTVVLPPSLVTTTATPVVVIETTNPAAGGVLLLKKHQGTQSLKIFTSLTQGQKTISLNNRQYRNWEAESKVLN